jgi:hypothetical protein
MEAGINPLLLSSLFYTKSGVFEGFVKFCQIKTNYAKARMLKWSKKDRCANLIAQVQPVEGDKNEK